MRVQYQWNRPDGGFNQMDAVGVDSEGNQYTDGLQRLKNIRDLAGGGGNIIALKVEVIAMDREKGLPLAVFEQADDANAYLDPLRQEAYQAAADRYDIDTVKTPLEPQPDGLDS